MPTRRTLVPLLVFFIFLGCSRKEEPAREPAASKSAGGWKTYQDEKIRVDYPEGWRVHRSNYSKENEVIWSVEPPGVMEDDLGRVMISEQEGTKRRPFESFVEKVRKSPARFINPPRNLKFKWGRCVSYPKERKYGMVFGATIQSHCYRDNGNYLSIWADIRKYTDNTKPDEDSLKNARIYERVLESLEFL